MPATKQSYPHANSKNGCTVDSKYSRNFTSMSMVYLVCCFNLWEYSGLKILLYKIYMFRCFSVNFSQPYIILHFLLTVGREVGFREHVNSTVHHVYFYMFNEHNLSHEYYTFNQRRISHGVVLYVCPRLIINCIPSLTPIDLRQSDINTCLI